MTSTNQLSILFIDEKITRQNYIRFLEKSFTNIYETESLDDAFTIYKNKKPNIIILEIELENGYGFQLLKKIRENDLATKIIVLTSNTKKEVLIEIAELKLSKFLEKPIKKEFLLDALVQAKEEISTFQILSNKRIMLRENFSWDFETKELKHHDNLVNLTKIEEAILNKLFKRLKTIVPYDELLADIWNIYDSNKVELVKTAIKKLRKKLPSDTILNIYGQGYKVI